MLVSLHPTNCLCLVTSTPPLSRFLGFLSKQKGDKSALDREGEKEGTTDQEAPTSAKIEEVTEVTESKVEAVPDDA